MEPVLCKPNRTDATIPAVAVFEFVEILTVAVASFAAGRLFERFYTTHVGPASGRSG